MPMKAPNLSTTVSAAKTKIFSEGAGKKKKNPRGGRKGGNPQGNTRNVFFFFVGDPRLRSLLGSRFSPHIAPYTTMGTAPLSVWPLWLIHPPPPSRRAGAAESHARPTHRRFTRDPRPLARRLQAMRCTSSIPAQFMHRRTDSGKQALWLRRGGAEARSVVATSSCLCGPG